jgi:hypothetical protein
VIRISLSFQGRLYSLPVLSQVLEPGHALLAGDSLRDERRGSEGRSKARAREKADSPCGMQVG